MALGRVQQPITCFTGPWDDFVVRDVKKLLKQNKLRTKEILMAQAKSYDHTIVRAQEKCPKGHPRTLPTSCSVVTGPQVKCEVICNQTLTQMLFQQISIHARSSHQDKNTINEWLWDFRVPWSPDIVLGLPPRGWYWKQSKRPWNHNPFDAM